MSYEVREKPHHNAQYALGELDVGLIRKENVSDLQEEITRLNWEIAQLKAEKERGEREIVRLLLLIEKLNSDQRSHGEIL